MKNTSKISHERLISLVHYDPVTGLFSPKVFRRGCRNKILGYVNAFGYRRIIIDYKGYLAHRLAWFYVHGVWPAHDIDHKNLLKDDNRIENLRSASKSQNAANSAPRASKSGIKGARWDDKRGYWYSSIKVNGKSRWLGCFDNPTSAHQAYADALSALHGEFARVT